MWIVDLAPETLDHDVDHVRHRLERCVPHVLGDGAAPDDLAGVEDEELEQRELRDVSSIGPTVADTSLARAKVEAQVAQASRLTAAVAPALAE